ncbi:GlxA family transcriptional regulator [Chromobacterium vaccinii]|uniref:GlxA family transcriptional regulator n=1 Tax=Chromobacterium vaccinii TaxID=1108595 RepID=UPI001E61D3D2|nr:GlxA family transcriptional regulator [Chromobacterium vaccinii]MCD4484273.1 GlxA family transcriptional regulator [Chromobacterium vaccinii]
MTRDIAILLFDGFQLLDSAGPISVFECALRYRPGAYRLTPLTVAGGAARSSSGIALDSRPLSAMPAPDTVLVAGGEGAPSALGCEETLAYLRRCASASRRVVSVCTGAFLLAEAGLLDGRRATTHWAHSGEFSRRYPAVALDTDRIYIRQGNIWTAAGVSAGIDVALALVAEDMGEEIARRCAQRLVVYYRRPGGQSQFSSLLEMQRPDGRFAVLLDQVRRSLDGVWDVESLAGFCCLSPRHFSRLFQSEVGMPPAKAVEQLRVEAARAALESGERSIQKVARLCGFGDAERMRRSFLRVLGRQPSSLLRSPADE